MAEGGAGKKYDKNILWEEEGGKNRREEDDHVEERIREKKIGFIRERKGGMARKWTGKNLHKGKKQVLDFFLAIEKDLW